MLELMKPFIVSLVSAGGSTVAKSSMTSSRIILPIKSTSVLSMTSAEQIARTRMFEPKSKIRAPTHKKHQHKNTYPHDHGNSPGVSGARWPAPTVNSRTIKASGPISAVLCPSPKKWRALECPKKNWRDKITLFLHAHREASALANELPEESDQFRFLRAACLANLKGSLGCILAKT